MAETRERKTGGGWAGARGMAGLHVAVLLFGVAGLFSKWISAPPLMIVFGRVTFAAALLGAVLAPRRGLKLPEGRSGWLLACCGALLAFHWGAFFHSIQLSSVAVGLLGYATAPVFATLLEPLVFRERFSRGGVPAALVALAGTALIGLPWRIHTGAGGAAILPGLFWGVAAGGSFALLSLANRHLRRRYDSLRLIFFQVGFAALALAPLAPWFWKTPTAGEWALLALLGSFCTALAHGLFVEALSGVTARAATLVGSLEPVYGIALAFVLLGERSEPHTLAGGVLILAAAAWVTLRPTAGGAAG
ncbi:MAG: DMT family transporter [bacterium]